MKNNDNKIINIIFRVVIIGAFFMGIRTIYNFYVLMITYKGISGEDMFNRVASMVDDYVMFMVFMVASVVFSVLARKLVNNNTFIIRTISIAVSLVCSVPELIAVYYFAMLTMVKYPQYANILGVSVTLNDVYTSSAAVFLQNNPYMFYTFFIGWQYLLSYNNFNIFTYNRQKDTTGLENTMNIRKYKGLNCMNILGYIK